jgi:hypothetical protein
MTVAGNQSQSNDHAVEPWAKGSIGEQPRVTLEALQKGLTAAFTLA